MKAADKIIVALDVATKKEAAALVEELREQISFFKIGLQLYTSEGPEIVCAVLSTGAKVWLDLKLHDIPNTVARAVGAAGELGVQMLTIHLSGGRPMLEAATAAKSPSLLLLGVTVLTSSTQETLSETGVSSTIESQVLRLGQLGKDCGIGGLITSPQEVRVLRENLGSEITLVTPGIRPTWAVADDQKRFTTPTEALKNGADYFVVGRPITAAAEPRAAVERLLDEMAD